MKRIAQYVVLAVLLIGAVGAVGYAGLQGRQKKEYRPSSTIAPPDAAMPKFLAGTANFTIGPKGQASKPNRQHVVAGTSAKIKLVPTTSTTALEWTIYRIEKPGMPAMVASNAEMNKWSVRFPGDTAQYVYVMPPTTAKAGKYNLSVSSDIPDTD